MEEEMKENVEFTEAQIERQDEIHNACFMAGYLAAQRDKHKLSFKNSCISLGRVMLQAYEDNFEDGFEDLISEIQKTVINIIDWYLSIHGMHEGALLDWDMEYIGEIADQVTDILTEAGLLVYYPYMTVDANGNEEIYDYVLF